MQVFSLTTRKLVVAVVLGPLLLLPLIAISYLGGLGFSMVSMPIARQLYVISYITSYSLLFAYPLTLFLGVPSALILKRFNKFNYRNLAVVGVLITVALSPQLGFKWIGITYLSACTIIVVTGCWLCYSKMVRE